MTVEQLYKQCLSIIGKTSNTPSLDARILIQEVLNFDSSSFILKSRENIEAQEESTILKMAQKRANGRPVAYIIGHRGFFEDDFLVNQDTLIPRADTEILVEKALDIIKELKIANTPAMENKNIANCEEKKLETQTSQKPQKLKILDLCCGTGCIGISVAKTAKRNNPSFDIELTLADISNGALQVCKKNALKILSGTKISWQTIHTDLFDNLKGMKFDLILSNPPYIKSSIIPTLEAQVRQEPLLALDGGQDGLDIIRKLIAEAPLFMENNGHLLMEIGFDEKDVVKELFSTAGFVCVNAKKDLGDQDRIVFGTFNKAKMDKPNGIFQKHEVKEAKP